MDKFYKGKRILVTGGSGSIGSELVRSLLAFEPKFVRIFDVNTFTLEQLSSKSEFDDVELIIGSVLDKEVVAQAVKGIDIVFHAAAVKYVPLCEEEPYGAVCANVVGTHNLIEAVIDEGNVAKFILISTDKAVEPISVMGATKFLAERITISSNFRESAGKTVFSCVRFGNVINSQGSVVPIFRNQVAKGGPVTVTDDSMIRFIMRLDDAVGLVLKAAFTSQRGEIFILKMPVLRIKDLAYAIIEDEAPKHGLQPNAIGIKIIGKRPGEKSTEELLSDNEGALVTETDDMFVLDYQTLRSSDYVQPVGFKSADIEPLTVEQIKEIL